MRPRDKSSSSFNLPVLLSFNELAWIAVFLMVLLFVSAKSSERRSVRQQQQLAAKVAELEDKVRTLTGGTDPCAALAAKVAALESTNNFLTNLVFDLRISLSEMQNGLHLLEQMLSNQTAQVTYYSNALHALTPQLTNRTPKFTEEEFKKRIEELTKLQAENERLLKEKAKLEILLAEGELSERSVRKELVGLSGGMSNVVIVVDVSSSMVEDNRWDATKSTVRAWLEHLPIRNCAVIAYSSDVRVLSPLTADATTLLPLYGPDGATNRATLLQTFDALKLGGNTDTLAALRRAIEFQDVDSIVLFTDGAPVTKGIETFGKNIPTSEKKVSKEQIEKILQFVGSNSVPRINTVGVGPYYKDGMFTEFLIELAQKTDGAFIGR